MRFKSLVQFLLIFAIAVVPGFKTIDPSPGPRSHLVSVCVFKGFDQQPSKQRLFSGHYARPAAYQFPPLATIQSIDPENCKAFVSTYPAILLNTPRRAPPPEIIECT